MTAENERLQQDAARKVNWKRWGPYLSERQWATVREDYSPYGTSWNYFTYEDAISRVYRWGEDGLLGITDRECRLCFSIALWNGCDPILKERLFGLTSNEGNHGEDVKEYYYYLDSTPTHSYMHALYKYPQREFPYAELREENRKRGYSTAEFELFDTNVFADHRYFDVEIEYGKHSPNDILIRLTITNRAEVDAAVHILPTLWFRNTWSWGKEHEEATGRLQIFLHEDGKIVAEHPTLGLYYLAIAPASDGTLPQFLFTENETNFNKLYNAKNVTPYVKDAFHEYVVFGKKEAVNPEKKGSKCAALFFLKFEPHEKKTIDLRLFSVEEIPTLIFDSFDALLKLKKEEADAFYLEKIPQTLSPQEKNVVRQSYASLLWTKQFYHYVVKTWLQGDSTQPSPPKERFLGRNVDWIHLYCRDVISMPDKWEYPWFAAWDLAFHMIPFAKIDADFAKKQIILFLREWYLHPNGQLPAYEFALSDVNPPVHAWSAWRIYKMTGKKGERDIAFLESAFQKLLLNFTWWVNRKDKEGHNLFSGGFLGLDNIGVFDRSKRLPMGSYLQQADGTAWMAFYCLTMLTVALELASFNPIYEDMASKFFEHFILIADAINEFRGHGLWDKNEGFYYDHLKLDNSEIPLRSRSLVGLIPLIAVEILEERHIKKLKGFEKRMNWFLKHRGDLEEVLTYCKIGIKQGHRILAIPSKERLIRMLAYILDEKEFLSPYGIRSLSKYHEKTPYLLNLGNESHSVEYVPGESNNPLFGGNSNWRGPIWFPINFLIIEALERYHFYYGDHFKVECPVGSGKFLNLKEVAEELSKRLCALFRCDRHGNVPWQGNDKRHYTDPHWKDLVLFHEYFHAETGAGLGASHQTGWTAIISTLFEMHAKAQL